MSKRFTVTVLIISVIFELYRIFLNSVSVNTVIEALSELNPNTDAYKMVSNTLVHSYIEIAVCCLLIILSVIACVVLVRKGKQKEK